MPPVSIRKFSSSGGECWVLGGVSSDHELDRHLSAGLLIGGDWSWCALAFFVLDVVNVSLGILELAWSFLNILKCFYALPNTLNFIFLIFLFKAINVNASSFLSL